MYRLKDFFNDYLNDIRYSFIDTVNSSAPIAAAGIDDANIFIANVKAFNHKLLPLGILDDEGEYYYNKQSFMLDENIKEELLNVLAHNSVLLYQKQKMLSALLNINFSKVVEENKINPVNNIVQTTDQITNVGHVSYSQSRYAEEADKIGKEIKDDFEKLGKELRQFLGGF
jgi:hypothetical protein